MAVKLGVPAALARYRFPDQCPFAVVFDLYDWVPVQPPEGSEWDYEPFPNLERATGRAQELAPDAHAEVWQWSERGWLEVPWPDTR